MFRGRRRSFRRSGFRKPLARKRLVWVTRTITFTETAGTVSAVTLLTPGDWEDNTTAGNTAQYCKALKAVILISSPGVAATIEGRQYAIVHDDTTMAAQNPTVVATYAATDCLHVGNFAAMPTNALTPVYNGYPDNVRDIRLNRRLKQDEDIKLWIQPAAAAANQLSITVFSRVLVQLG